MQFDDFKNPFQLESSIWKFSTTQKTKWFICTDLFVAVAAVLHAIFMKLRYFDYYYYHHLSSLRLLIRRGSSSDIQSIQKCLVNYLIWITTWEKFKAGLKLISLKFLGVWKILNLAIKSFLIRKMVQMVTLDEKITDPFFGTSRISTNANIFVNSFRFTHLQEHLLDMSLTHGVFVHRYSVHNSIYWMRTETPYWRS